MRHWLVPSCLATALVLTTALPGTAQRVQRVVFGPNGAMVVTETASSGDGRFAPGRASPYLVAHDAPRHTFQHQGPVHALAFLRDGRFLATGSLGMARVWGVASGTDLRHLGDGATALAVTADGKTLVTLGHNGAVSIWDPSAGTLQRRLAADRQIRRLAVSPDGHTLALAGRDGLLRLLDLATGAERARLRVPHTERAAQEAGSEEDARVRPGSDRDVLAVAFSPDGKVLASATRDGIIRLWDVATGQELRHMEPPHSPELNRFWGEGAPARYGGDTAALAFSPDGRMLATSGDDMAVHVWDVASGHKRGWLSARAGRLHALAFSGDGHTLATGGADHTIRLWEVATSEERRHLVGHTADITALAFSPDDRSLASASTDHTARIWDLVGLTPPLRARPPAVSRADLEKLWADLASTDAARAYCSLWLLADAGEQAIPFLRTHLPRADGPPQATPERLARLIAELDDPRFEVRERATDELEQLGRAAESALRQALGRRHSAEQSLRVHVLLENLLTPQLPPERLRPIRAVEVLERVGTPDARRLVEELAGGPPDAPLTREAKAALGRLSRPTATR